LVIWNKSKRTNVQAPQSYWAVGTKLISVSSEEDRQCMYTRKIHARSWNNCCSGKAISITYSEHVYVALVNQHAKRMRLILLSSVCFFTIFFHIIS